MPGSSDATANHSINQIEDNPKTIETRGNFGQNNKQVEKVINSIEKRAKKPSNQCKIHDGNCADCLDECGCSYIWSVKQCISSRSYLIDTIALPNADFDHLTVGETYDLLKDSSSFTCFLTNLQDLHICVVFLVLFLLSVSLCCCCCCCFCCGACLSCCKRHRSQGFELGKNQHHIPPANASVRYESRPPAYNEKYTATIHNEGYATIDLDNWSNVLSRFNFLNLNGLVFEPKKWFFVC